MNTLNGKILEIQNTIACSSQPWIHVSNIPEELWIELLRNGYEISSEVGFGAQNSLTNTLKISWEHACPKSNEEVQK
jgi:hypothetical protein